MKGKCWYCKRQNVEILPIDPDYSGPEPEPICTECQAEAERQADRNGSMAYRDEVGNEIPYYEDE